ncbi:MULTISPECIES: hypothetical protein [unclassified Roseitalea]|uniref:hypothetical protein n=1 Tax=unclassified Roseitalea TaxID=2639107 RepID=UPI00273F8424|nr:MULTISPECIES: hypothetical protein [unclassified Roseitalea]
MRFHIILAVGSVAGLTAAQAAFAQSTDPAWLDEVTAQLARDEQCQVEYYVNIAEGELAGRRTFEARAQCRDGRQFDAARTEPEEEFTLSLCEVQVC